MLKTHSHASTHAGGNLRDTEYRRYVDAMNNRLDRRLAAGDRLFRTRTPALWHNYLDAFPFDTHARQYHTCAACRGFIEAFGGLVFISPSGALEPAFWHPDDAPPRYRAAAHALRMRVIAQMTPWGPFFSDTPVLGTPITGHWRHFSAAIPDSMVWRSCTKTAAQAEAEKREDFRNVRRALDEYPAKLLAQAVDILRTDALYRAEKILAPVEWLHGLSRNRNPLRYRDKNVIWRAVADAPAGFCHPRSSVAATLLDDLACHVPFDLAKQRFDAKMHPARYQRPRAAPNAGAIDRAEKLVEQMGIERSLERRPARIDECTLLWSPHPTTANGVFGHLRHSKPPAYPVRGGEITWARFEAEILPGLDEIQVDVPTHGAFFALVTAVHPDAPPILRWDSEHNRNPVSWYTYVYGSPASRFNLRAGRRRCIGVVLDPAQWSGQRPDRQGAVFLLDGARDTYSNDLALFPETLRPELHEVRKVIERHSNRRALAQIPGGHAAGLSALGARIRAKTRAGVALTFRIDRWA